MTSTGLQVPRYVVFYTSLFLVPLKPEYLPQHAILESPQPMLFPHYDRPSCTPMKQHTTFFFCVNRHCNPCGFWPARLSLIILSRKVFTECPNLEDQWLERSNSRHQVSPTSEMTRANPSSGRWNYGRENSREFCRKWRLPRHFWVLLHAVNLRHVTDGFTSPPKEGTLTIFRPKNSTDSTGFEPANLGTKGQHAHLYNTEAAEIIIGNAYYFVSWNWKQIWFIVATIF